MNVFELKLKLYLLRNIKQEEALSSIALFIDEVLYKDEDMKKLHKVNCFKNYVFCSFYPVAQKGIYIKDSVYTVIIRTIDYNLAVFFYTELMNHNNAYMKGLTCEIKKIEKRLIDRIYSITPIILKDERGYWKKHLTLDEFERRLKENLIKKYNTYIGNKIDEKFQLYDIITFLNKVPIKIPYKDISLLGDKIEIKVSDNTLAQELIHMSLGTGLCESNARGFGFVNYQWYKEEKA